MSVPSGRSFVRFVLVGILNTGVGLALIFAAKWLLGWGDLASNVFGYAVGLAVSFVLNRNWSFEHRGAASPALLRFLAVFLAAYSTNLITVFGLKDLAQMNAYLAQAAGVIPYTILFYLGSRAFVFPPRPSAEVSLSRRRSAR